MYIEIPFFSSPGRRDGSSRRKRHETYLSAQQGQPQANARISGTVQDQERTQGPASEAIQGKETPGREIGRIGMRMVAGGQRPAGNHLFCVSGLWAQRGLPELASSLQENDCPWVIIVKVLSSASRSGASILPVIDRAVVSSAQTSSCT
jgi:hypothetical protein